MEKRLGAQTIRYAKPPVIANCATVAGPMEGAGTFGSLFDVVKKDNITGESSWEKAERKMVEEAIHLSIDKSGLAMKDINFIFGGDLLNQIVSVGFAARQFTIPFFGLYGACSTIGEALILAATFIDGGYARHAIAVTSSHHDTAERQYRYPTEFGVQRYPTSQWTATGAASYVVTDTGNGPRITYATVGKVVDVGTKDVNDMGSAMAPAAADTIWQHLRDTGRHPGDYGLILTGDLGEIGSKVLVKLMKDAGMDIQGLHNDCGLLLYSKDQDVHAGGSGCACSALVFGAGILGKIRSGEYGRVLLVPTGALHSTLTWQQKETIPAIAHAISVEHLSS